MQALFLVCAIAGAAFLILQLIGAGLGDSDHAGVGDGHDAHEALSHGLHLFSVRALTAGLALFGTTGWFAIRAGWPSLLALAAALPVGFAAMAGIAYALRSIGRLESDGAVNIANAIGLDGVVHLRIPESGTGAGKVMVTVQGRLVELPAVTSGPELPTGVPVTVVDARGDTLDVRSAGHSFIDEV
jgi:hypothetical protein